MFFHEVEVLGDIDKEDDGDSKIATNKIKIGAKLDIAGLVKASIDYTSQKAKKVKGSYVRRNCGASSATGNCGASITTGYQGKSKTEK